MKKSLLISLNVLLFLIIYSSFVKGSVFKELPEIVLKVTGSNPLDYLSYGCWCGLGGNGTVVDDIDKCCFAHDKCYSNAKATNIFNLFSFTFCIPHLASYKFSAKLGQATCKDGSNSCAYKTCMCDKILAECFYMNRGKFNKKYIFSPKDKKEKCKWKKNFI